MKKIIDIFSPALLRNAMLMVLVVASLAACKKDAPVKVEEDEPTIETEEYSIPTKDTLNVVSDLPAYILPYNYQNFGAALVNRMQNRIAVVDDENIDDLATMIIHSSHIENMIDDWPVVLMQLLVGRNIIIVEPTVKDFKLFCNIITLVYIEMNNYEEGRDLLNDIDMIPGARQTLEAFYDLSNDPSKFESMFLMDTDDSGIFAEAIAVRGSDFHIVDRMTGVAETETSYEQIVDDEGNTEPTDAPEVEESKLSNTITAYSYGLFADMFTKWINEQENSVDLDEEILSRAAESLGTRATETQKHSLEDISSVQKIEYTISASSPYNLGPKLPVTVKFEICSIYMEDEDCDYYCIYKNILSYNQVLDCGPAGDANKRKWREADHFGFYAYSADDYSKVWTKHKYYGPFMRDIEGRSICHVHSNEYVDSSKSIVDMPDADAIKSVAGVVVEKYSPKNSIGSVDKSDGFSYGFDGGLYLAPEPSVNLGFSVSWDTSTSQTIDDLEIVASTADGVPEWTYEGQNLPDAYYNLILECSHSEAPTIMRRECEVDQSWIWKVPNPTGSYRLFDETQITTSVMCLYYSFFEATANFVNQETTKRVSFLMMPPPRSQQRWMMGVTPYSPELNSMIATTHSRYWKKDDHEFVLNDTTDDSRISIEQFINDFKRDLKQKRHTWKNRNFMGTYTFSYYIINDDEEEELITFDFVVE
ncbi:MAG: hypothetical protein IIV52_04225 [Alistipes sp.]|nr:hypothetical protein [Alistipes sp.]